MAENNDDYETYQKNKSEGAEFDDEERHEGFNRDNDQEYSNDYGDEREDFDGSDDDLSRGEGSPDRRMKRRSEGVEHLGKTRLTKDDYSSKYEAAMKKKVLTVPRPFDFDNRDNVKSKSIRERKVEAMVNDRF